LLLFIGFPYCSGTDGPDGPPTSDGTTVPRETG
jgi:hypothetical protein